jgi:hypothetical protein
MNALSIKIDSKKYRIIAESDYMTLLQDIKDLKKVLKRRNEKGVEAREFFDSISAKSKANK